MDRRHTYDFRDSILYSGPYIFNPNALHLPFTATGTERGDTMNGRDGIDIIGGNGGDDSISGGGGDDWIVGGSGNDWMFGDAGDDHIYGEAGEDAMEGGDGSDTIHGGAGNDGAWGGNGNDTLYGEAGDDLISGGAGNDIIDGGDGNDDLDGGWGEDKLYGGAGNDILDDTTEPNGGGGHDWFYGGDGDDRLITAGVADALAMNAIDGGAGFDRLELATDGTISNIGALANVTDGIEAIGLGYAWNATLIVNPQDVLDFSDTDTLYITGGHDHMFGAITSKVDSTSNAWTAVGTVQAFDNVFTHYQATVNGQHADLYVDTLLPQAGVTA